MQDGDTIMGEGGPNAPSVSEVAKRLEEQDLQGGGSETASVIIERVRTEAIIDQRKVAKTFLRQSKLAKSGNWAGKDNRSRRELTRVEARALERHLPRTTPLPTLLLLRTWRST
jgi:hypothetical protein